MYIGKLATLKGLLNMDNFASYYFIFFTYCKSLNYAVLRHLDANSSQYLDPILEISDGYREQQYRFRLFKK